MNKNQSSSSILVVGAGFAGATYARKLAEAGYQIHVIDQRSHIAGNAYDEVDENGLRIHKYGPHLFHTKNESVVKWVKRFADWIPYEHRVRAQLKDRRTVPLPINMDTINILFDKKISDADGIRNFLDGISVKYQHPPANAAEWLYTNIGKELTDLLFRPYTLKMWDLHLEEMDASVVKRIPLRFDRENRYFPDDDFQALPRNGYTDFFQRLLDHPAIRVSLGVKFQPGDEKDYYMCFNSMPIDEFYDFKFGELPYRSIRFHHEVRPPSSLESWATTNFTDAGPYTRETRWEILPCHLIIDSGRRTITKEEPCDYRLNNFERYYPVKTADGRYIKCFEQYKALAKQDSPNIEFIGRCGTYQYLDMHQVINQSIMGADRFIAKQ